MPLLITPKAASLLCVSCAQVQVEVMFLSLASIRPGDAQPLLLSALTPKIASQLNHARRLGPPPPFYLNMCNSSLASCDIHT
jgi:hypothetical protein